MSEGIGMCVIINNEELRNVNKQFEPINHLKEFMGDELYSKLISSNQQSTPKSRKPLARTEGEQ